MARNRKSLSSTPVQPAVFLDRDNTLIVNDGDLGEPSAVRLVDGVAGGLRALREAGYRLVVVTNQAGVARGRFSEEDVDAVHQRIATLIDQQASQSVEKRHGDAATSNGTAGLIDRFYYCPYHPEATVPEYRRDHPWRKPHPGMILQAARDMGLDLTRSWMIGDQERDVLAGKSAGCRTVLFSRDADLAQRVKPTDFAATFADAVRIILAHRPPQAASPNPHSSAAHAHQSLRHAPATTPTQTTALRAEGDAAGAGQIASGLAAVRRAVSELTDEIRNDRIRRGEFRFVTMLAGLCQLLALTLGILGLLQLAEFEVFAKWMLGAAMVQMVTLTLVVLDTKG